MLRRYALPATTALPIARVAVLGAIVSALFFMHGTPAAVGGCQGAAAMLAMPAKTATQASAPPVAGGHGARSVSGSSAGVGHHIPVAMFTAGGVISPHAAVCLFTAPRRLLAAALPAAAGVLVGVWAWRPGRIARRARPCRAHAPPCRALLTRLCVARA